MAVEKPTEMITRVAHADYSEKQYRFVKINGDGEVELSGAGENAIGVLQDTPLAEQACNVMTLGITKVVAGSAVTSGNNISSDANGEAIPTAGAAAALGIALESAADGDVFTALLVTRTATGANSGFVLGIPVDLAKIADGDLVTDLVLGINGTIKAFQLVVTDPVTTAAKLSNLHLEIGATAVTGGVLALTSAACTPLGKVVAATAITAANVFTSTDKLSVVAADTVTFTEGKGVLLITIQ